jgi:hypothetical protein
MSLLIEWDGTPVCAGPIWTRKWDGSSVSVSFSGIRSILALRRLIGTSWPAATQQFAYTDSLPHIMQQLIQNTMSIGTLPITFEANSSGDAHQLTWYGFDLQNIDTLLGNLNGYVDGPDFDFQPVWNDSSRSGCHYVMRTGTPYLVTSNVLSLDGSQPQSPVTRIQLSDDASKLSTTQWAKGSGSDVNTLMSKFVDTSLTAQGWPLIEQETDYTTVTDQSVLDAHTQGDQAAYASPTQSFVVTIQAGTYPQLGTYDVGDLAFLTIRDHVWVPDGDYTLRIIQTASSSDSQAAVDLTMQEAPSATN